MVYPTILFFSPWFAMVAYRKERKKKRAKLLNLGITSSQSQVYCSGVCKSVTGSCPRRDSRSDVIYPPEPLGMNRRRGQMSQSGGAPWRRRRGPGAGPGQRVPAGSRGSLPPAPPRGSRCATALTKMK